MLSQPLCPGQHFPSLLPSALEAGPLYCHSQGLALGKGWEAWESLEDGGIGSELVLCLGPP